MQLVGMRRRLVAMAVALVVLAAGVVVLGIGRASAADRGHGHAKARGHGANFDYVAMWENIDLLDGSRGWVSITPGSERGGFDVMVTSEFMTICGTESGQGYGKGTAEVVDGELVSEDYVIFCEDGPEIAGPVTFEPQRRDDLLIMTLVGVDRPPFFFHRVSSNHRGR